MCEELLRIRLYHYQERMPTMNEFASIVDRLKALKLSGMAEAASDIIKLPIQMRPSLEMALSKMLEWKSVVVMTVGLPGCSRRAN